MKDIDVRIAVRRLLDERHQGDADTRRVEEMGLWSGAVRIDLAIINGELQGFELKSARDTLERLGGQAELYNQVFDRVTLVTAERHICAAMDRVPGWWGIMLAYPGAHGETSLREIVPAALNPTVDPLQLARLLWRDEALGILQKHGCDRGVRSRTVEVIANRLAERLSLATLKCEVRQTLKNRLAWLGQPVTY